MSPMPASRLGGAAAGAYQGRLSAYDAPPAPAIAQQDVGAEAERAHG